MSHTKKKFVNDIKLNFDIKELDFKKESKPKISNELDLDQGFFFSSDNKAIQAFVFYHGNKPIGIPEPEPCILYFTNAEKDLKKIETLKSEILSLGAIGKYEQIAEKFYLFFQLSTNFTINLFMSIEAFNNSSIPNGYKFKKKDKLNIQRYTKFKQKTEEIIPDIFNKSFVRNHKEKYKILNKLKGLRDSVVHTKNFSLNYSASYRELFREYLRFDFSLAYNCTKDYLNYYTPDLIENCECGLD